MKKEVIQYFALAVIVIAVLILLCDNYNKKENFNDSDNLVVQSNEKSSKFNPQLFEPVMTNEVKESQFVGLPEELLPPWYVNPNSYGEIDMLDDGMNGNAGVNFNMCSKSCCSRQYAPPFSVPSDPMVKNSNTKFVPNNYMCNDGWNDSGCLCLTETQSEFLNSRGGNQ